MIKRICKHFEVICFDVYIFWYKRLKKKKSLKLLKLNFSFPFFCRSSPPAIRGELQPQLLLLELLEANHDGLLVHPGLSAADHQPDAHHLLLHPPHQLCRPDGPRRCQGRPPPLFFPFNIYRPKCAIWKNAGQ